MVRVTVHLCDHPALRIIGAAAGRCGDRVAVAYHPSLTGRARIATFCEVLTDDELEVLADRWVSVA